MINQAELNGKLALDANGLNKLKQAAKESSPEAIKATARQFEAMFMNMMLKSMREATPQDSPFDSEQSRSFTAMLDQQLSQTLAARGMGLADVLARQLTKTTGQPTENSATTPVSTSKPNFNNTYPYQIPQSASQDLNNTQKINSKAEITALSPSTRVQPEELAKVTASASNPIVDVTENQRNQPNYVKNFQQTMLAAAQQASQASGIPAQYMIGQAALESGWGKREIRGMDGSPSYNLFGIKATGGWKGKVVEAVTTEYINGEKQKRVEKFRAYNSYADSFMDFANLIRNNPRYDNVIGNGQDISSYAQALQKGGYATDPKYAEKLKRIIQLASSTQA